MVDQGPKEPFYLSYISGFSYPKKEGQVVGCCMLLGIRIPCPYSCPFRSDHNVPVTFNKTDVILYSAAFISTWMRSGIPSYHVYFKLKATLFYKEPTRQSTGNWVQRLELKEWIQYGVRFILFYFPVIEINKTNKQEK